MDEASGHIMRCMEIWGGNRTIDTSVEMAGLEVRVYSRPHRGSPDGGDIHYLSSCATGRISRLIVADVSGHGAEVGAIATNLRRLMCKYSNYVDQSRLVEAVNRRFGELRAGDERFSGLFATAVVATYFAPTDRLSICNAGHPRPLRFEASSGRWTVLESRRDEPGATDLPLGVLEETRYGEVSVTMGEGDLVLVYTDPLLETRDPGGRQLGEVGLLGLVAGLDTGDPVAFLSRLRARIAQYAGAHGEYEFDDDVTMMLLRRHGVKPRPSPLLGVKAAGRLVRHALGAVAGGDLPVSIPQVRRDSILGAVIDGANRGAAETRVR